MPSEQVIAKSLSEIEIVDARGRKLTLKKPGVLAQYRLVEMLGNTAANQTYVGMVLPLIYLSEIDGVSVPQPVSKRELEALIQRLDEDGIEAVSTNVMQSFGKSDPDADKAALKN